MKVEQVRELFQLHRGDKNYHFRNLSEEEFRAKALVSFNKLTDVNKEFVQRSWGKTLKLAGLFSAENKEEHLQEMMSLRFLAQTNLFFMCRILGYNLLTEDTHEDICNEFFVQKDPTYSTFKKFADSYKDTGKLKRRMILVPRGGFKSTINMADCVQYIVGFPEITIAILTGTLRLAELFVGEVRAHFEWEKSNEVDSKGKPLFGSKLMLDPETGEWSTSMFQVLFPEHCIKPEEGKGAEYQTPAVQGGSKESTIMAGAIEQTLSGLHFDILKLDDVVTNENCNTPDRIEKVNRQISVNRGILNPYGFFDVIGTWYDEQDYYGQVLALEEKMAAAKGLKENIKGSIESGIFNSHVQMVCYVRAAWYLKAGSKGKPESQLGADDYDYWFPSRLDFNFLTEEKIADEFGFAIKYLNNPRLIGKVRFPRELLIKHTIPYTQMPPMQQGKIVTVIDTAYSTKNYTDYTVILTAMIFGGRFYILNMKRGRWNEYDLPIQIALVAAQWKPSRISIEESVGVAWLTREVRREMTKLQVSVPIDLVSLGKGSKQKNKANKAKPVIRLMNDSRIYILMTCEGREEIYTELELFTGTKDDKHDDIVSTFSILVDQYGAYADADASMPRQNYVSDPMTQARHDMIHGLGRYANQVQYDDNPVTQFQIEQAAEARAFYAKPDSDPLGDLF